MRAPYVARYSEALGDWHVFDTRRPSLLRPVAGPYTQPEAEALARHYNAEHVLTEETTPLEIGPAAIDFSPLEPTTAQMLVGVLEGQGRLNDGIARALEALALQAERYDSEIAELRRGIDALTERCEAAERAVRAAGLLHSVKS